MFNIETTQATLGYSEVLKSIKTNGQFVGKTKELLDLNFKLAKASDCFTFVTKQHWVWALYELSDRLDPQFVNPGNAYKFRPTWHKKLVKEGGTFCYAYGEEFRPQLPQILRKARSKSSREAVMTVWRDEHLINPGERTPCTLSIHFLRRVNNEGIDQVHGFVDMRTNDVMNLLPYDLFHHGMLISYVAAMVGSTPGMYVHRAHQAYYQKRREKANIDKVIAELDEMRPFISDDLIVFNPLSVKLDMTTHHVALGLARNGKFNQALDLVEKNIKALFIREWTQTLIKAEATLRGHDFEFRVYHPIFKFINNLGYHLTRRRK